MTPRRLSQDDLLEIQERVYGLLEIVEHIRQRMLQNPSYISNLSVVVARLDDLYTTLEDMEEREELWWELFRAANS